MAAITKNPIGGIGSKVTGDALTKATGIGFFKSHGDTMRKYHSDPFGSASSDWKKMTGRAEEESTERRVVKPSYTGYRG